MKCIPPLEHDGLKPSRVSNQTFLPATGPAHNMPLHLCHLLQFSAIRAQLVEKSLPATGEEAVCLPGADPAVRLLLPWFCRGSTAAPWGCAAGSQRASWKGGDSHRKQRPRQVCHFAYSHYIFLLMLSAFWMGLAAWGGPDGKMLDAINMLQWLIAALKCKIRVRKMLCPTSWATQYPAKAGESRQWRWSTVPPALPHCS